MKYTNDKEVAEFLEAKFQKELEAFAKSGLMQMHDGLTYVLNSQKVGYTWVTPCHGKYAKLKLINIASAIGVKFDWNTDSFIMNK